MLKQLRLINVTLPLFNSNELYTLMIDNGIWQSIEKQTGTISIGEAISIDGIKGNDAHERTVDLEGKVLLPGLVDAHMHLDKSFSLPQVGNTSGTLEEAVQNYSNAVPRFSKREIKSRIIRSALQAVSFGTTAIRTHLDFHLRWGSEVAMRTIEAAIEAKEELAAYIDIQLFPLTPYIRFTEEEKEVLETAIQMGLSGVGGAPHLSPTPERDIDIIFELAEKYNLPLDFHTDESDDPNIRTLSYIAKRTIDFEMLGNVTVDHLCSLASMKDQDASQLIKQMLKAELNAITLPGANLYLQGRHDDFPVRRGVTRVKQLLAAGVPIATASDNIHDPFHPFGRGDLIQIGLVTAYAAHMGSPADMVTILKMITEIPAKILGLKGYGVAVGNKADFVVFDGNSPESLFTMLPERRWVYRNGGWLKMAPNRAEWQDSILEDYWNEARNHLVFK
jgi:cytosine/creatinine deaminase